MPKSMLSSSSVVEEKVNARLSESEPMGRYDVGKRQTPAKRPGSESIDEHRALESMMDTNPASVNDANIKSRQITRNTEIKENLGFPNLQAETSNIATTSTTPFQTLTIAEQNNYTSIASTFASDFAQQIRARALPKKYGLDGELESIKGKSKEDKNDKNINHSSNEDHLSNSSISNLNNNKRTVKAVASSDEKNISNKNNMYYASNSKVERIRKPILIRIKRRCHRCQAVFGDSEFCEECDHEKCTECPRSPLPGSVAQKPDVVGTRGSNMAISRVNRPTRAATGAAAKGVARIVTKWLDDMEPLVEGTALLNSQSSLSNSARQPEKHPYSGRNPSFSPLPRESTTEKKKKKKKRKKEKRKKTKKAEQQSDNGNLDSQNFDQPHIGTKVRSTPQTHGPTIVIALPSEAQHIPPGSPRTNFKSKSRRNVNKNTDANNIRIIGSLSLLPRSEICHACHEIVIPILTSICPKCQHARCENCPASIQLSSSPSNIPEAPEDNEAAAAMTAEPESEPASTEASTVYRRAQHQSHRQVQGDEYVQYLQNIILAQRQRQRVYKKPRIRVRWACDLCFSILDPQSSFCVGCRHKRCKNCIRDPEKRKHRYPDPDTVQALEARLSSILLHE